MSWLVITRKQMGNYIHTRLSSGWLSGWLKFSTCLVIQMDLTKHMMRQPLNSPGFYCLACMRQTTKLSFCGCFYVSQRLGIFVLLHLQTIRLNFEHPSTILPLTSVTIPPKELRKRGSTGFLLPDGDHMRPKSFPKWSALAAASILIATSCQ